jgi:hypothetical protein
LVSVIGLALRLARRCADGLSDRRATSPPLYGAGHEIPAIEQQPVFPCVEARGDRGQQFQPRLTLGAVAAAAPNIAAAPAAVSASLFHNCADFCSSRARGPGAIFIPRGIDHDAASNL